MQDALRVIAEAEDLQRRGLVLAMLMKLKQICNHPAQFLHQIGDSYLPDADEQRSGKLARLVELMEELLAAGDRALIFTQFAEMGHLLRTFSTGQIGKPGALSAWRRAGPAARRDGRALPRGGERPADLHFVAQSGRDGPESDRAPTMSFTLIAGGTRR